jgi:hypothetical protein
VWMRRPPPCAIFGISPKKRICVLTDIAAGNPCSPDLGNMSVKMHYDRSVKLNMLRRR